MTVQVRGFQGIFDSLDVLVKRASDISDHAPEIVEIIERLNEENFRSMPATLSSGNTKGGASLPPLSVRYVQRTAPVRIGNQQSTLRGRLRESLTSSSSPDAVIQISRNEVFRATRVPYAVYVQKRSLNSIPTLQLDLKKLESILAEDYAGWIVQGE